MGRNQIVSVIYDKNLKSKRLVKKYSQSTNMCYFAVYLWKSFSLQPILTPSQWLKNGLFFMKCLSQDKLHVNDMCAKIQAIKLTQKNQEHPNLIVRTCHISMNTLAKNLNTTYA